MDANEIDTEIYLIKFISLLFGMEIDFAFCTLLLAYTFKVCPVVLCPAWFNWIQKAVPPLGHPHGPIYKHSRETFAVKTRTPIL